MCDFATGLSRQLYGLTMPSERPEHRLQEIWQPLGVVGCVTAFNFPVAVFGWNFCLAAVCGNSIIWKPSPHAEGCADLVKKICGTYFVLKQFKHLMTQKLLKIKFYKNAF